MFYEKSEMQRIKEMYKVKFRNEHSLYSFWGRDRGSNLSKRFRVMSFGIYLFSVIINFPILGLFHLRCYWALLYFTAKISSTCSVMCFGRLLLLCFQKFQCCCSQSLHSLLALVSMQKSFSKMLYERLKILHVSIQIK